MDTLLAVQKLFRLRALIQDSSLSPSDVLVKPTKEPHPTVQLKPQDIRVSPSWSSPAGSAHPPLAEPLPPIAIPIPKTFLRKLSMYTSPRPNQMLASSSKSERQKDGGNLSIRRKEGRAFTLPGLASERHTQHGELWSEHGSYLPRAKPPAPLKRIKHARHSSKSGVSPDPLIFDEPPTLCHRSSRQSLKSDSSASETYLLPRRRLDGVAPEMSAYQPAGDSWQYTWTSATNKASDDRETFTSSDHTLQPPTRRDVSSKAASGDEDDRPKPLGWFTRRKTDGLDGGNTRGTTSLHRVRSFRKLRHVHSAGTQESRKEEDVVSQEGALSPSGVVVKCCEGDGWHEKSMADIIPKLRELKLK